jgi:deazaflavin-dependent oxidoreductase (nitroreductase family)
VPLEGEYAPGTSAWARRQAEQYEATDGAEAATIGGRPIVVVTSLGARTGRLRKTAVMRVEHEGRYAVVGSRGGGARNPAWVHNLWANPLVELQDGPERRDYLAREPEGDEREAWWERAVAAFPTYATYQRRTSRVIQISVLEPVEQAEPSPAPPDAPV